MKTECIVTIGKSKKTEGIENFSIDSLRHHIMVDDSIKIDGNDVKYKSKKYTCTIQEYGGSESGAKCFYIMIGTKDNSVKIESSDELFIKYEELVKRVRSSLYRISDNVVTLWDDLSFYYAQKAYPQIYEIENLMRKLITKFMLINIGSNWEETQIPDDLKKASKAKEKNEKKSLLYNLDFIDLSDFLFSNYVTEKDISELGKYVEDKNQEIFEVIDSFIPKSNWNRYFKDVVEVEGEHLKKAWEALYKYRCKVAHNNMFLSGDLAEVERLITDLKKPLQKAYEDLDSICLSEDEREAISEKLVKDRNAGIGELISCYEELNRKTQILYQMNHDNNGIFLPRMTVMRIAPLLYEKEIITKDEFKKIRRVSQNRNAIVHGMLDITVEDLEQICVDTQECSQIINDKINKQREQMNISV